MSPENASKLQIAKKTLSGILTQMDANYQPGNRAIRQWRIYARVHKFALPKKHIAASFAFLLAFFWLSSGANFTRYNKCLMGHSALIDKLFRPVEDCSLCSDVQEIEKLSNVGAEFFEKRFAYAGKPVIVTDGARNWTAMDAFSFSFLKSLYDGDDVQDAECQFFPYNTEFRNLGEVFRMGVDRALMKSGTKPWYVGWSNCDQAIGAVLRQHYRRPYFLPETSENEKTDWIFMGSPGYGAPMHIDDVGFPSWQAQIRGQKLWTLEPPRECIFACNRLEAVVNPGEINTNRWYHQTQIVSSDISITIGAEYD